MLGFGVSERIVEWLFKKTISRSFVHAPTSRFSLAHTELWTKFVQLKFFSCKNCVWVTQNGYVINKTGQFWYSKLKATSKLPKKPQHKNYARRFGVQYLREVEWVINSNARVCLTSRQLKMTQGTVSLLILLERYFNHDYRTREKVKTYFLWWLWCQVLGSPKANQSMQ